jgi:hypothetical protein
MLFSFFIDLSACDSTSMNQNTRAKYVQDNILLAQMSLLEKQEVYMPYPSGHRSTVQKKIIDSARRLFNRYGFEKVTLSEIMAGAGLPHGGFYGYFDSKSDLYAEVLRCFFTDPDWKDCWEGVHIDLSPMSCALHAPWSPSISPSDGAMLEACRAPSR